MTSNRSALLNDYYDYDDYDDGGMEKKIWNETREKCHVPWSHAQSIFFDFFLLSSLR